MPKDLLLGPSTTTRIATDNDVTLIRDRTRRACAELGFRARSTEEVVLAVTELATNVLRHAGQGIIELAVVEREQRRGLRIESRDEGPGIANVELAIQDGFSSARGLGMGLPSMRRLTDEFRLDSVLGRGTQVTLIRWLKSCQSTTAVADHITVAGRRCDRLRPRASRLPVMFMRSRVRRTALRRTPIHWRAYGEILITLECSTGSCSRSLRPADS